jgi:hypothetical protein
VLDLRHQGRPESECRGDICVFGSDPQFWICVSYGAVLLCWHVYAICILRQHWLNKRDGRGDARNLKKKEVPAYMAMQTSWVEELN